MCIFEVIDTSPSNLDFCFRFIQSGILHDVLCIELKQSDNIQPFQILNHAIVPCLVLTVVSGSVYRFLRRQVRWSDIPISLRIFCNLL